MYGRNQHNIVKQFCSDEMYFLMRLKKEENSICIKKNKVQNMTLKKRKKWAKIIKGHVTQEDTQMANTWKDVHVISHQRNAMRYHYVHITTAKIKNSIWQHQMLVRLEKLGFSYITDGNVKWHSHSRKESGSLLNNKICNSNYTPGHLFQKNKNLDSNKNLYVNAHSKFICNTKKQNGPRCPSRDE